MTYSCYRKTNLKMFRLLLISLLGLTFVSCKSIGDPCIDNTYSEGTLFLYTDGCYPYYYECVHGKSLQRPCAPGTVFDTAVGVCNHPRDTAGCTSETTTTTTKETTTAASLDGCHGHIHEDLYILDNGCYNYFYQCSHGTAYKMPCAADLAFDTTQGRCNYQSEITACGEGFDTTTTTTKATTSPVISDGCHGHLHEDLYILDDGCYNYFYQCSHGTAYKMPCAADLAFDTTQGRCNYQSEITACEDGFDTTTTTTKATTSPSSTDGCHGHLHEDLYILDDGCYNYFYQCSHGTAYKMPCAADLAFDTTQGRCNYQSEITACEDGFDTTTTTTKATTTPVISDVCHGHSHGDLYILDDGCYNYFYQCSHGTAYKMPCAADLSFDTTQGRCNYQSEITACETLE